MPRFKVEIEKPCANQGNGGQFNPFKSAKMNDDCTVLMNVRSWEFDADNEEEVRKFFKEAQEQDMPQVRGYRLRSIQQVAP